MNAEAWNPERRLVRTAMLPRPIRFHAELRCLVADDGVVSGSARQTRETHGLVGPAAASVGGAVGSSDVSRRPAILSAFAIF
jgi:hypothetical protein